MSCGHTGGRFVPVSSSYNGTGGVNDSIYSIANPLILVPPAAGIPSYTPTNPDEGYLRVQHHSSAGIQPGRHHHAHPALAVAGGCQPGLDLDQQLHCSNG